MIMSEFYNTISLGGEELKKATSSAASQCDNIMKIFYECIPGAMCTPANIHEVYCMRFKSVPITSIRRAMTDLTDEGKLEKTTFMSTGAYGKPNYRWRLKVEGEIPTLEP